jgi:hypothetical protein
MSDLYQGDLRRGAERADRRRACRIALPAVLLAALSACRAPPAPRVTVPEPTPPPAAHEPLDASYDWHALLIAPFGSVLKDIPAALHEVLLFRDEARAGTPADEAADAPAADAECYAADAPAPRFVGRIPDEYLLCFRQGRLSRVQASVRLTAAEAPDVFAAACAGWLKSAAPSATSVEAPGAAAPGVAPAVVAPAVVAPRVEGQSAAAPMGAPCEGRDGGVRFRGRLGEEPGRAEMPQTEAVLSITLDSAPDS